MANVKIKLTKEQQQYIVFAVMVLGGGGFAFFKYFWIPTSTEITKTRSQIKSVEGSIRTAKNASVRLQKIRRELDSLNAQAAAAEKRLPKKQDLPKVFETMVDLTRQYNIKLQSFAPGSASPKQHFIEVPYGLKLTATYHDLGRFLAAIALEERIFNVRNVTFPAPDSEGKMNVSLTLISYQYKG